MKKYLASILIVSSCFAMKSGLLIGIQGGGNLSASNQRIDYQASGNVYDLTNTTSGAGGTSIGSRSGNYTAEATDLAFSYMMALKLGYLHSFTPTQGLRAYATFGSSQVRIGTKSKNSAPYFSPKTYNLIQAGLALDYMIDFINGFGMFVGLGYEQGFGDFSKQTYAVNAQPYGNIGFFGEINESGFFIEVGAKLPFLAYYSGDPRFRDDKTKFKYIYLSNTTGTEYNRYKEHLSGRVFQFYIALSYVL